MSSDSPITIITAWGEGFGNGHIQRMIFLYHLLRDKGYVPLIVTDSDPASLNNSGCRFTDTVPGESRLIIRDMRDSTPAEIQSLKSTAPVVVIDDCGEGRRYADLAIDLLPHPDHPLPSSDFSACPFLFGFNFVNAMTRFSGIPFEKDIDILIYTGLNPSPEYLSFIHTCIPEGWKTLLADGNECALCAGGKKTGEVISYAESLLRSKILLTHFGISLFEGNLCGCALASVNPTEYHSSLARLVRDSMGVINFGVFGEINPADVKKGLKEITVASERTDVTIIQKSIMHHAELFLERIEQFIR